MGWTVYLLSWMLHEMIRYERGISVGLFFPTKEDVSELSAGRFNPMIQSVAEFRERVDINNVGMKRIDPSLAYFRGMKGVASKDSTPLDAVGFDEVRLMAERDIEQAKERMAASPIRRLRMGSTAGFPDCDIDSYFKLGTREHWHTDCGCSDGVDLASVFPDCIATPKDGEPFYWCPRCKRENLDPQKGHYVAHGPEDGRPRSWTFSQMVSSFQTAADILRKYDTMVLQGRNVREFFNAVLGTTYVDRKALLLTLDQLTEEYGTVDRALSWATKTDSRPPNCGMGIDQRGGELHIVIKRREGNKNRTVHVEVAQDIDDWDPWRKADALMREYDIDVCVCDKLPQVNEAMRFAKRFEGRVFLSVYSDSGKLVRWLDQRDDRMDRPNDPSVSFPYECRPDRSIAIEWTQLLWATRRSVMPPPSALVQSYKIRGRTDHAYEVGKVYMTHLTKVAKEKVLKTEKTGETGQKIETGEYTIAFKNLGLDPHFLHADLYCNLALARQGGGIEAHFVGVDGKVTPEVDEPEPADRQEAAVVKRDKGYREQVEGRLAQSAPDREPDAPGTCSECSQFDEETGFCGRHAFTTKGSYAGCDEFEGDDPEVDEEEDNPDWGLL